MPDVSLCAGPSWNVCNVDYRGGWGWDTVQTPASAMIRDGDGMVVTVSRDAHAAITAPFRLNEWSSAATLLAFIC